MKLSEAIEIAEDYQRYRRGLPPYDWGQDGCIPLRFGPEVYGQAFDILIHISKEALKEAAK
jgi:hypothetical protein